MGRTPRFDGRTCLVSGILSWILLCLSSAGSAGQVRLLDLENQLVDSFHAPPFDMGGRIVDRGRIDDRFVTLGVERPGTARRDLDDALTAVLAGTPVPQQTTPAVGCFIADFLR
jgi:hypothetical protein